jgi:hypothetical protein
MSNIQEGKYAAKIRTANVTETQNGKSQVEFDLILEGGTSFLGRKSLEGGAFKYTLDGLRRLGFNDDWFSLDEQLAGKECKVTIKLETGQSDPTKLYPVLAFIDPVGAAKGAPAAKSVLSRLAAQTKATPRPADAPKKGGSSDEPF